MVNQNFISRLVTVSNRYSGLFQQMTAGVMAAYLLFVVGFLVMSPSINYYSWRYFLQAPLMASFSTLFALSLCWQSWISISSVIQSYWRVSNLRTALLWLTGGVILFYFAGSVSIIWDIYT